MINEDVREIIEAELQPGEKLLWADKPARMPKPMMMIGYCIFSGLWLIGLISMIIFGGFLEAASSSFIFLAIPLFMLLFGLGIFLFSLRALRAPSRQLSLIHI